VAYVNLNVWTRVGFKLRLIMTVLPKNFYKKLLQKLQSYSKSSLSQLHVFINSTRFSQAVPLQLIKQMQNAKKYSPHLKCF